MREIVNNIQLHELSNSIITLIMIYLHSLNLNRSKKYCFVKSLLLGFVIGSFGVQNLFLCFWRLGSFVLRSMVEDSKELLQKDECKG